MNETLNYYVLENAYGWTIDVDGNVCGLVAGDMGYENTGIKLEGKELEIWKLGLKTYMQQQEHAKWCKDNGIFEYCIKNLKID